MSEILVITCPSGKQCSCLIPLLYNKGRFALRLAAHSHSSAAKLRNLYPSAEVVVSDLTNAEACRALLHGAAAVYHVGPSLHSHEKEIGFNMVDAAVAESQRPGNVFRHFVFSSVLATQHRRLVQHDLKSYIEERLYSSPLSWTILQPTNFMDAFPIAELARQEQPVLERLWNPEIGNSVVALRDLAEASAKVLNEGARHYLAQYPLSSTMPVSDVEIAGEIERQIGKKIELRTPSFETGVKKLLGGLFAGRQSGLYTGELVKDDFRMSAEGDSRPDITRDEAERLVLFYNRRGLVGSPNVLRWLLGREPTSIEEYVRAELESVQ